MLQSKTKDTRSLNRTFGFKETFGKDKRLHTQNWSCSLSLGFDGRSWEKTRAHHHYLTLEVLIFPWNEKLAVRNTHTTLGLSENFPLELYTYINRLNIFIITGWLVCATDLKKNNISGTQPSNRHTPADQWTSKQSLAQLSFMASLSTLLFPSFVFYHFLHSILIFLFFPLFFCLTANSCMLFSYISF